MSKQDRQGVRTAPDLERRYGFGKSFREVRSGIQTADRTAEQALHTAAGAAETAQNSRAAIDGMTVSAQTLAPGSAATVEKTDIGGVTNLHFGIPQGEPGQDAPADPVPPMEVGAEYRTGEQWQGKPVYRKLVSYANAKDIGAESGVSVVNINHDVTGMDVLLRCNGQVGNYILPYISTNGGMTALVGLSSSKATLTLRMYNTVWTPREWLFDMAYTKEETT